MADTKQIRRGGATGDSLAGLLDGFEGYYRVARDDLERAYRHGLIVLDTNALLDLYRLSPAARGEMLSLLNALAPRLFVPYQLAWSSTVDVSMPLPLGARNSRISVSSFSGCPMTFG